MLLDLSDADLDAVIAEMRVKVGNLVTRIAILANRADRGDLVAVGELEELKQQLRTSLDKAVAARNGHTRPASVKGDG